MAAHCLDAIACGLPGEDQVASDGAGYTGLIVPKHISRSLKTEREVMYMAAFAANAR